MSDAFMSPTACGVVQLTPGSRLDSISAFARGNRRHFGLAAGAANTLSARVPEAGT